MTKHEKLAADDPKSMHDVQKLPDDDDDELQAKHPSQSGATGELDVSLPVAQSLTAVPKASIGSRADSLPADVAQVDCLDPDE